MSFWIRRTDKSGRHLWLIDTHPELLLGAAMFAAFLILVVCLKFPLFLAATGIVSIVIAKASAPGKGPRKPWRTENMPGWNARVYKAGFVMLATGIALMLAAWLAGR